MITDSDNQFNMSGFYTGTGVLDPQSSFTDSGKTSTATYPDLVSGNDISGDSATIEFFLLIVQVVR